MKVLTILGARPQFIKAAPVSVAFREAGVTEVLVHTGQHYDYEMSQVFFDELGLPAPEINLGIGSGPHGQQTGRMLEQLEKVLLAEEPDWVLVYGDTNSTLAGALAAVKLQIPLAHVEAGLRSYNRSMPEEHNRVLTDHCADLLFCPTATAVENLAVEGISRGVHQVGDTMYDAVLLFREIAHRQSSVLVNLGLEPGGYVLATVHRPYNTDDPEKLGAILKAFGLHPEPVIFPVHPRTRAQAAKLDGLGADGNLRMIPPVSYFDMLVLIDHARLVVTDSGGMQKEAYFLETPCLTLRPETEWVETLEGGWNRLVEIDKWSILQAMSEPNETATKPALKFGNGNSAGLIIRSLLMSLMGV